jgi:hypothetical protein
VDEEVVVAADVRTLLVESSCQINLLRKP